MDNQVPASPIPQISDADWLRTPLSVQQFPLSLLERLNDIEQQVNSLKDDNLRLREQAQQTSSNSSRPANHQAATGAV